MTDVVVNKIQSIQRCVVRAREEYNKDRTTFDADFTRQDAALLNVLRACEQCIDLANHVIKVRKLGVPSTSGECFEVLERENIISDTLAGRLKKMVQFRNILVHRYQRLDMTYVRAAIEGGLDDIVAFGDAVVRLG